MSNACPTQDRQALQTFVLAANVDGQKELLSFEIPVAEFSREQLLQGEHHARAIDLARRLGRNLKDFVAFDENSPAADQMRGIFQVSGAHDAARVVLRVEGGLIHEIASDQPISVLILDADVEGASASDVTQIDAVRDAVYIRLEEIDSHAALRSQVFVGQAFDQARAFLDSQAPALAHEPQR